MSAPRLAFVLAAGQSTRMRSKTPKVLHLCAGKPLLRWSLEAAAAAGARSVVVVSPDAEVAVRAVLPPDSIVAIQPAMRGTGDAVRIAVEAGGPDAGDAFVIYGDTPTLTGETLQ